MSASASSSTSSLVVSKDSKATISDFGSKWQENLKKGWKSLKKENKNAKNVIIKGKEHPSTTVSSHTNVVSCQTLDAHGNYLGSAHIDEDGTAYPNEKWAKNKK